VAGKKHAVQSPADRTKEAYIRFMAPVVPQTAAALMNAIDTKIAEGVKRLHLLISCPGGSVFHGLSIYNFLRGAPIEVFTYNFGSVDSIGVVIFCAGSKRFSVPHARFLIHGITASIDAGTSLDERALEEVLKGIKIDYENIARVISDTTGQKIAKVMADMNDRTTLSPHESVAYGLVHSEISALFPAGADLYVVGENVAAQLAH
jgi:ATP-dependent protease ClpP protease subunit